MKSTFANRFILVIVFSLSILFSDMGMSCDGISLPDIEVLGEKYVREYRFLKREAYFVDKQLAQFRASKVQLGEREKRYRMGDGKVSFKLSELKKKLGLPNRVFEYMGTGGKMVPSVCWEYTLSKPGEKKRAIRYTVDAIEGESGEIALTVSKRYTLGSR